MESGKEQSGGRVEGVGGGAGGGSTVCLCGYSPAVVLARKRLVLSSI